MEHNFTEYSPDLELDDDGQPVKSLLNELITAGAAFIRSEEGNDWYEVQKKYQSDTVKLMIDPAGIVRSFDKDASKLWPAGCSVIEVSPDELPDDININGEWKFSDGQVLPLSSESKNLTSQT